jgi:hypothetical protein
MVDTEKQRIGSDNNFENFLLKNEGKDKSNLFKFH